MTMAFVLGNGVSRQELDIRSLRAHGPIYGCNALYREFIPDVLVATDTPISQQIQHSNYAVENRFYTRHPVAGLGAYEIPQQYWKYSSGPAAIGIAAQDGHNLIYIIGFDMGPTETGHFNNVYAGTEFYKKVASVPTYTGNWANQIKDICNLFLGVQFIRVMGTTTAKIATLETLGNLAHCSILEFQKSINKTEDP